MKFFSILSMVLVFTGMGIARAGEENPYTETISIFKSSPALMYYFKNSYGYAVFPTIGKAGYVIGGSYGQGEVFQNGEVKGSTTMIAGSIGFQVGAQAFSEIIFFEDKRAYNEFISGNFEFGANAEAVAITVGAQAQAGTGGTNAEATSGPRSDVQAETNYIYGMAPFIHTVGGLMLGASVGGQKFTFEAF